MIEESAFFDEPFFEPQESEESEEVGGGVAPLRY